MAADSTFAHNWTTLIARAWVDPQFRSTFEADPSKVMGDFGIHAIDGQDVSELAGRIQVVDHPVAGHDRPFMSGECLILPFPSRPQESEIAMVEDSVTLTDEAADEAADDADDALDASAGAVLLCS